MNNLQPTSIVDKNGKATTVHKRVDSVGGTGDRSLVVGAPVNVVKDVVEFTGEDFSKLVYDLDAPMLDAEALRARAEADYRTGTPNKYSHHYDAMWAGKAVNILGGVDGWSEAMVLEKRAGVESIMARLESEELDASDILVTDDVHSRSEAIKWCNTVINMLDQAIATEGRSLDVNAAGARERYADYEGGRNLR